jgi:hypothetical protein
VPLESAHAAGAHVSATAITLIAALIRAHPGGAQVAGSVPSPGARPVPRYIAPACKGWEAQHGRCA